ncbi:MAG TPA: DUF3299 domain-containing protein [Verrucomicrobiota bacterium]|nr:hypothetical protein [Verrucomicrobiales bacterium]HRI15173.1 DUF3299 domain-containing protein [Verrucomicrobiota bacterium]
MTSKLLPSSLAGIVSVLIVNAGAEPPPRGEPIKPLAPKGEPIKPAAAAPTSPSSTSPAVVPAPSSTDDQTSLGFDKLSAFKYEVPEDSPDSPFAKGKDPDTQIPESVKAYSGKRISLKGFMLPLKVEQGLVTELLIMRDQSMCCFGTVPRINEWVSVKMTGKGVKPVMDQAVTLVGTLKVGAIRENGYLVGIYQMDGERMDGPAGL